jgi:Bacterial Ig domain
MRRIAVLALALAGLVAPASASATINPSRNAPAVVDAMSDGGGIVSSAFTEITPPNPTAPTQGEPVGISDTGLSNFPLEPPAFPILSTGDARAADPANGGINGNNNGASSNPDRANAFDITTLRVNVDVPPNATCITFGFRFFTNEGINAPYNDGFIAELDANNWTINPDTDAIIAPSNFAFDTNGQVISVHSEGATALSPQAAANTSYTNGTAELAAARSVAPGAHSVYFTVFDQGDHIVDSAVFLDHFALLPVPPDDCKPGARTDNTPPAVSLTSPANGSSFTDSTPVLSGAAGDAAGDLSDVFVNVAGQTLRTTRSGAAWSLETPALAPGTYTATASQADASGNTGSSGPVTFTVLPQQQVEADKAQSPEPVLGETVVAGKVGSGTVKIRLKNGKFRTLGANESIPLGSEIDATKGRVRLTSAAGKGGATQTADFYKGAFIVTQTKGSKPITQLKLSGKLACSSRNGKARTSAKGKKVRRLWGDGKGRFRTRGRRAAATVRGTKWLTEDRCDRTTIRVRRGTVSVRDLVKKKTKIVKKGQSYTARDRVTAGQRRPK